MGWCCSRVATSAENLLASKKDLSFRGHPAIVTLGQNLGLDLIAEGVETGEQLTQLRTMGCNYGQGYYFSKLLDSEGATTLIATAPVWLMHDLPASFNCIPSHPDRRPQTTGKPLALTSDLTSTLSRQRSERVAAQGSKTAENFAIGFSAACPR